jgi:predicted nucleotidyltransferase
MKFGLLDADLSEILLVLESFPEIREAKIFGSRAKGNHHPGSDVDIALVGEQISLDVVAKVHFILEEQSKMPYLFDVVDYTHLAAGALREHIDRVGVTIFKRAAEKS